MIPVPVEVEVHTVPLFKAPINIKLEPQGPEHGGILILLNTRSKIGQLLHKLGHFDSDMHTTVQYQISFFLLQIQITSECYLKLSFITMKIRIKDQRKKI